VEAATSEEWDEVVGLDGETYRVLKEQPAPNPPLPVSDEELVAIDAAIAKIAKIARRRGVSSDSVRNLGEDKDLCRSIDELIVEALTSLRPKVKSDSAEKLFERLMEVCDSWEDKGQAESLGLVFVRFMDTMEYLASYRGKFRGVKRRHSKYSRDEAHKGLAARGLTKK
jgi:hypothetical protein